jgi:hypothetical protein
VPVDASDRTLGLTSIWQVLRKFVWEIELLKTLPESIRVGERPKDILHTQDARIYAAINACSTSLALVDWLFHTVVNDPVLNAKALTSLGAVDLSSDKAFLKSMRATNPALNMCHQVCNANKHFHLHSPRTADFKIMVAEIVMSNADGTTDLAVKMMVTDNGHDTKQRGHIEEILKGLADWWYDRLVEIQIPRKDEYFPTSN